MTALADHSRALKAEEEETLARHREDVAKLLAEVAGDDETEEFVISDDADLEFASKLLLYAKKNKKDLEDRRKSVTQPLNSVLTTIRGWFREPIAGWEKLERLLKRKIGEYELVKSQEEDAAIAQIAVAAQEDDYDKAHQASMVIDQERPKVQGVVTSERWVLDEEHVDLEKAPREFLVISLNKPVVKEYIRQFGKGRPTDLPGLPFKKEVHVTGSTKG